MLGKGRVGLFRPHLETLLGKGPVELFRPQLETLLGKGHVDDQIPNKFTLYKSSECWFAVFTSIDSLFGLTSSGIIELTDTLRQTFSKWPFFRHLPQICVLAGHFDL